MGSYCINKSSDYPNSVRAIRQQNTLVFSHAWANTSHFQQFAAITQCKNGFAVLIGVFYKVSRMSIACECHHRLIAIGQHQRIKQHCRGVLHRLVCFNIFA